MAVSELTYAMPGNMPRVASSMPAMTSSLTALALAPGVLNTTMPRLLYSAIGTLLTPAPARAAATSDLGISTSASFWLRSKKASGWPMSLPTSYD